MRGCLYRGSDAIHGRLYGPGIGDEKRCTMDSPETPEGSDLISKRDTHICRESRVDNVSYPGNTGAQ